MPASRRRARLGERLFRVLVLDDDEEVVSRFRQQLAPSRRRYEGRLWRSEISIVHVRVESTNGETPRIADQTLRDIADLAQRDFDLIVTDYGFAAGAVLDALEQRAAKGESVGEEELLSAVLTLPDLHTAAQAYAQRGDVDARNLEAHFVDFGGRLRLYSYTSRAFVHKLHPVANRVARTRQSWPDAVIIVHDTKTEFYNGSEFDWPGPTKHDRKFHAHLTAMLVKSIIETEFLERVLRDARRLKYVRVERSVLSVALIVAIGGAVGAAADWLGGRTISLWSEGFHIAALAFAGLAVFFVLAVGLTIPFVFERIMSGLIHDAERDTTDTVE